MVAVGGANTIDGYGANKKTEIFDIRTQNWSAGEDFPFGRG